MKSIRAVIVLLFLLIMGTVAGAGIAQSHASTQVNVSSWSISWTTSDGTPPSRPPADLPEEAWRPYGLTSPESSQLNAVWIRLQVPELKGSSQGILLENLQGKRMTIFAANHIIYKANYNYQLNQILFPLQSALSGQYMYMWLETDNPNLRLEERVQFGDFQHLFNEFLRSSLDDIILGSTLLFMSAIMLVWSFFTNRRYRLHVLSLALVILSAGVLVFTYSPFLYTVFEHKEELFTRLYDLALLVLLPSFSLFFETVFGSGYRGWLRTMRRLQTGYSLFCLLFMSLNMLSQGRYDEWYYVLTAKALGMMMMVQLAVLVFSSIMFAVRGSREAVIFSVGLCLFAGISLGELFRFYMSGGEYTLMYWKWGAAGFVVVLIMILGRIFTQNHEQVIQYSRELKMFNQELQRSEKMEIISELAASVAHEVRNPLQVTRGFLQLISGKSRPEEREYLNLALVELDRASGIITDFLTFAKPESGRTSVLRVLDEFTHIEGILTPLAHLHGSKITVDIPTDLWIRGNSSKFKQALINIVKNSIEAIQEEGMIHIQAYRRNQVIYILIRDNGEGMKEEELVRLGEPYFSNKSKGTGLGLMVTFRIIEAMEGQIQYSSKKGVGTEALITLPAAVS
ncbi:ATP-binding protein [Paenibacillus sp. JSM ZJ436]|uniref:ATP-binding protein n=1 Tax=Paenibacillus sp. JSM ZJ436 TaxID=3376190 RepID=UPI003789DF61